MNKREIASLAFRITGIYTLIEGIQYLGYLSYFIRVITSPQHVPGTGTAQPQTLFMPTTAMVLLVVLPVVFLAVVSYILILRSHKLAVRMFPEIESEPAKTRVFGLPMLAYSVVGIFLVASSFPSLINVVVYVWKLPGNAPGLWPQGIGGVLKFILGLALFFGSHGFVRLWSFLRKAGIREAMGLCSNCAYDLMGNVSGVCPECGHKVPKSQKDEDS